MKTLDYIRSFQKKWFDEIRPFLLKSNLNVGSGLGYFSNYAKDAGVEMTSLEVYIHPGTINPESVILYNGDRIPFEDDSFECLIAMYVLHHTLNPETVLNEMRRVSSRRIVLVEEVYRSLIGKMYLLLLDFWVNFKARQKSDIHWKSYFSKEKFRKCVEKDGWETLYFKSIPRLGFDLVLCIIDKPPVKNN